MARLYGDLQIARFNQLYYQQRAEKMRRISIGANSVSAIAASAVFAGLFRDGSFAYATIVWQGLTALAALCAALSPVLGLESKASQFEKAALGHGIVHDRVKRLLSDLKLSEGTRAHEVRDAEIDAFRASLAALDESPSESLRDACWKKTLEEYPSERAWSIV